MLREPRRCAMGAARTGGAEAQRCPARAAPSERRRLQPEFLRCPHQGRDRALLGESTRPGCPARAPSHQSRARGQSSSIRERLNRVETFLQVKARLHVSPERWETEISRNNLQDGHGERSPRFPTLPGIERNQRKPDRR